MACIYDTEWIDAAKQDADAMRQSAIITTAINTALALWQRNSSASLAGMQEEIAKRQRKLADYVYEHAKKFWPYEKAYVDDAFGVTKATPQYSALSAQWGAISKDSLTKGRTDWLAEVRRRCLVPTKCEAARFDREAQRARVDVISFADRHAEARATALNDMRYARMYGALAMGKGVLTNITKFEALMGAAGTSAAKNLIGSINSGLELLGYASTRRQFTGWGQGARQQAFIQEADVKRTVQYPAPEPAQAFAITATSIIEEPGCGPMPSRSSPAWNEWNNCMGYK